jgi:hypothetical protein
VYKGQGDGETKWKGWSWKLLRIKLVIKNNDNKYIIQIKIFVLK